MKEFDESISLFAPHVRQLTLDDRVAGSVREFQAKSTGKRVTLTTDRGTTTWIVVSREHTPSAEALESAGTSARREKVNVSWAIPSSSSTRDLGQLCAYFPIKSAMTLRGRVNAPWKLSDDRIDIIACRFNEEILSEVLPALVVDARRHILDEFGPATYIDVLPSRGRGREIASWADGVANEPIYQALRGHRSLPAAEGALHSPTQLRIIPLHGPNSIDEDLSEWIDEWVTLSTRLAEWVHPDCTANGMRRSKVERLMEGRQGDSVGRLKAWLEDMVGEGQDPPSPAERSIGAVSLAGEMLYQLPEPLRQDIRESRIVLLSTGDFQVPQKGRCFIAPAEGASGSALIDSSVSEDARAARALDELGVTEFGDGSDLLEILRRMRDGKVPDWDELWSQLRGADIKDVRSAFAEILNDNADRAIRVRGAEGAWIDGTDRFLPNPLRATTADSKHFVDEDFHRSDEQLLELLGIRRLPSIRRRRTPEKWVKSYLNEMIDALGDSKDLGPQVRQQLEFDGIDQVLTPIGGLPEMSGENRITMTASILGRAQARISARHPRLPAPAHVVSPELWWLRKHGVLATDFGPLPIAQVFAPEIEEELQGILPTATSIEEFSETKREALKLRSSVDEARVDDFTRAVELHRGRGDTRRLGLTYAWWCHKFPDDPPNELFATVGDDIIGLSRDEVAMACTDSEVAERIEFEIPFIQVLPEDLDPLVQNWDLKNAGNLPITYEFDESSEPRPFEDYFPAINSADFDEDIAELIVQPCQSIRKIAAIEGQPAKGRDAQSGRDGDTLLVCGSNDRERLRNVLVLLNADHSDEQLDHYETLQKDRSIRLKTRELGKLPTNADRLLELVGEDRLISLIDDGAINYLREAFPERLTGTALAQLCLTMWGPATLEKACRINPGSMEITPPSTPWNGSRKAREWVRELGFP